jgi:hypothetical protein
MSRIALDSKSHQAIREQGTEATYYGNAPRAGRWKGKRLTGLIGDLSSSGHTLDIVNLETDPWTDESALLIVAGRCDAVSFTSTELKHVAGFYQRGGGLLLMANHPQVFVAPQNQVCHSLVLPLVFQKLEGSRSGYSLRPHYISQGCQSIAIRRFCRLSIQDDARSTILAQHTDPQLGALAVALEAIEDCGRAVAVGSAGHIASLDDSYQDLYAEASNASWTLRTIEWLLGAGLH